MRIHTTAVPATKYLPERIHVKLTDDNNVPNNIKDRTYLVAEFSDVEHDFCANNFIDDVLKLEHSYADRIGNTLTMRGYVYKIVESV
jgi:hypothetical protein